MDEQAVKDCTLQLAERASTLSQGAADIVNADFDSPPESRAAAKKLVGEIQDTPVDPNAMNTTGEAVTIGRQSSGNREEEGDSSTKPSQIREAIERAKKRFTTTQASAQDEAVVNQQFTDEKKTRLFRTLEKAVLLADDNLTTPAMIKKLTTYKEPLLSPTQREQIELTTKQLANAEVSVEQLKGAGISKRKLQALGISDEQLRTADSPPLILSKDQLDTLGLTDKQKASLKLTSDQYKKAGVTEDQLVKLGISKKEFQALMLSKDELEATVAAAKKELASIADSMSLAEQNTNIIDQIGNTLSGTLYRESVALTGEYDTDEVKGVRTDIEKLRDIVSSPSVSDTSNLQTLYARAGALEREKLVSNPARLFAKSPLTKKAEDVGAEDVGAEDVGAGKAAFILAIGQNLMAPKVTKANFYVNGKNQLRTNAAELVQTMALATFIESSVTNTSYQLPVRVTSFQDNPAIAGLAVKPINRDKATPRSTLNASGATVNAAEMTSSAFNADGRLIADARIELPDIANQATQSLLNKLEEEGAFVANRIALLTSRLEELQIASRTNPNSSSPLELAIDIAAPKDTQGSSPKLRDSKGNPITNPDAPFITRADNMVIASLTTLVGDTPVTIPLSDLSVDYPTGADPKPLFKLSDIDDSQRDSITLTFKSTNGDHFVSKTIPKEELLKDRSKLMESPNLYGSLKVTDKEGKVLQTEAQTIPNYEELSLQVSAKQDTRVRGGSENTAVADNYLALRGSLSQADSVIQGSIEDEPPLGRVFREIASASSVTTETGQILVDDPKAKTDLRDLFVKFMGTENKTSVTIAMDPKSGESSFEEDYKQILMGAGDVEVAYSPPDADGKGRAKMTYTVTDSATNRIYTFSIRLVFFTKSGKKKLRSPYTYFEFGKPVVIGKPEDATQSEQVSQSWVDSLGESWEGLLHISYKEFIELIL